MSATTHNSAALYSLQEQPGSSFTTTRGGFDTGRRVFKCWQSVAATLEPARGSSDSVYPGMKVDTVVTTFDRAGVATIEVNYLGLKNETQLKEDEFNYSVTAVSPAFDVDKFDYNESLPKPQVTHTYLTRTLPTDKVGDFSTPAKYADLIPGDSVFFIEIGVTWHFTFEYRVWQLAGRTIKNVGDVYEVSDTHQWLFQIATITQT